MTVGLVFYFGYAGLRKTQQKLGKGGSTVAVVNGESIPKLKFDYALDRQMRPYLELTKNNVPPALLEMIREGVLEKLIENKLFAQQARAIGMGVSDKELAREIGQNPQFFINGVFSKKNYFENFKPYYEREVGEDFEESLREELLAEKFEKLVRDSISVSDEEIKQEYVLGHTQLNLQKVSLKPPPLQSAGESQPESQRAESQRASPELEAEILKALGEKAPAKGASSLDLLKKKYDLKTETTGFHSLRDKTAFVGDPQATEALECILKLKPETPLCPQGYPLGNEIVYFKLVERKEPDLTQLETEKAKLQESLLNRKQTLILKQIAGGLLRQANVRSYLKPSG